MTQRAGSIVMVYFLGAGAILVVLLFVMGTLMWRRLRRR